ncbi:MAG TPA: hypothetical protein VN734_14185 [Acidobacteriaceae bacterium]|nr:hypothetical protein [Acidobacteriaceae bacterium]
MSKPSKIAGEKPIGLNRNGINIYRPSARQRSIANSLAKTKAMLDEAVDNDNVSTGGLRGR